jgi:phosphoribosylanthranilate isomerase
VQLHGDEDAAYCAALSADGRAFIKALRLRDASVLDEATHFSTRHLLLDAHSGAAYGGTGTPIDLGLAAELVKRNAEQQIILAGGLRPETVAAAIVAVRPFAVDVASGVESPGEPRRKDSARLESFFRAVRESDAG